MNWPYCNRGYPFSWPGREHIVREGGKIGARNKFDAGHSNDHQQTESVTSMVGKLARFFNNLDRKKNWDQD